MEQVISDFRDLSREEQGIALAKMMAHAMNSFSNQNVIDAFIEKFQREHRTLQQSMVGMLLQIIEAVASDDYRTDGRNQASHETCKLLVSLFNEHYNKKHGEITEGWIPSKFLPLI